jgi:hypothetical protein
MALCRTRHPCGGLLISGELSRVNCCGPGTLILYGSLVSASLKRSPHGAAHEWTDLPHRFELSVPRAPSASGDQLALRDPTLVEQP